MLLRQRTGVLRYPGSAAASGKVALPTLAIALALVPGVAPRVTAASAPASTGSCSWSKCSLDLSAVDTRALDHTIYPLTFEVDVVQAWAQARINSKLCQELAEDDSGEEGSSVINDVCAAVLDVVSGEANVLQSALRNLHKADANGDCLSLTISVTGHKASFGNDNSRSYCKI